MALGELTKQLAQHAIGNVLNPSSPAPPEGLGPTVVSQIQAMQKALKEDDELAVSFWTGSESIRVFEIYAPSSDVLVLSGTDGARNRTRVVSPAACAQMVCKVQKVPAGAKPTPIQFKLPKG